MSAPTRNHPPLHSSATACAWAVIYVYIEHALRIRLKTMPLVKIDQPETTRRTKQEVALCP